MKLFGLFCIGALAQAPSPAKNCADCKAFDAAFKDELKSNPNLINDYVQLVSGICAEAGSLEKLCDTVAGPALKKYLTKISTEDATKYCTEIAMCQSARAFWSVQDDTDCTACTNFIQDLALIAQYDPNHFTQIFDGIAKGLCNEVGGFEAKICYSEISKQAGAAAQAFAGLDPQSTCSAIQFC